jgi:SOS-response transcriptional repressor LexA
MLHLVSTTDPKSLRRKQLAWLNAVLEFSMWNVTRLAREAGVSQSTLAKFLNDPENLAQLSTNTVEKVSAVGGIRPYETKPATTPRGIAEKEAIPFSSTDEQVGFSRLIAAMTAGNSLVPWVLNSRALEAFGYLPGDILIVDLNATAQDGDIVCAQLYDRNGEAETVFRIFEHPFLVAATMDRKAIKPLLIDNSSVVIRGVVTSSHRPRAVQLAS